MFRDRVDRIWILEYTADVIPLTQMRFDIFFQNERYLIQRSPPPQQDGEKPRRAVHGVPIRAPTWASIRLCERRCVQFVERERAGS